MSQRKQALLQWLQQQKLVEVDSLVQISSDAGFRQYYRFTLNGKSLLAVDAPPKTEKNREFVALSQAYIEQGVRTPKVEAADLALGFLCIEDFGDSLLSSQLNAETVDTLYWKALSQLPQVQKITKIENTSLPAFDQALLETEYSLFTDWLMVQYLGIQATDEDKRALAQAYELLCDNFSQQPQVGVHRDFHSRNLLVTPELDIGVIDFQDAVTGPLTYDLVSLLRDCYVQWPQDTVSSLLQRYHQAYCSEYSWSEFKRWFDLTGVQRHVKASGIFARLYLRDNKGGYLNDIPATLRYILQVGSDYPQLHGLVALIEQKILPAVEGRANG